MDRQLLTIEENKSVTYDTWYMKLSGDCSAISAPGQFINIRLDGFFLRRPISIYDHGDSWVSILYKVLGKGTAAMSKMRPKETLDVLLPLGNGFDVSLCTGRTLLAAGGIGMPPMYGIAKELCARGITPQLALGFNTEADILPLQPLEDLGIHPVIATADGSCGIKGFVTDAMDTLDYDYVCTCGPEPMLKAVYEKMPAGQLSFEERMGCGFGACMGCSCKTKYGNKRICKDGPVLLKKEIVW